MSKNLKVLVADDMEILARNMVSIIAGNEHVEKVKMVTNGKDLIDTIVMWEPNIVFTDMRMPILTGLEVIQQIYLMTEYDNKPQFILVTSDRDVELIRNAREYEFDLEYKPISADKINEYINNYEHVGINEEAVKKNTKESGIIRKIFKK